jgi:hypothetical protein
MGTSNESEDQGRDRTPPGRERDVQVWARAHGVSADELGGDLDEGRPESPDAKERERRMLETRQSGGSASD